MLSSSHLEVANFSFHEALQSICMERSYRARSLQRSLEMEILSTLYYYGRDISVAQSHARYLDPSFRISNLDGRRIFTSDPDRSEERAYNISSIYNDSFVFARGRIGK